MLLHAFPLPYEPAPAAGSWQPSPIQRKPRTRTQAHGFIIGESYMLKIGHSIRLCKMETIRYSFPDGSQNLVFRVLPLVQTPFASEAFITLSPEAAASKAVRS